MARWRPAAALVLALACCRCPRAGSDASAADPDGRSLVLSSVSQEDPDRELPPLALELPPEAANMSGEEAYYMGEQLLIRGQSLQAAAFLARAAELLPGDSFSHGNLAIALHQMGRSKEAVPHFRAAASLNPAALYFANLGQALWSIGDISEAIKVLRIAVRLDDSQTASTVLLMQLEHYTTTVLESWAAKYSTCRRHVRRAIAKAEAPGGTVADLIWTPSQIVLLDVDEDDVLRVCRKHTAVPDLDSSLMLPPHHPRSGAFRRLRLGYLSYSFGLGVRNGLMYNVFEAHDRARVEVFGFAIRPHDEDADAATRAQVERNVEHFVDISKTQVDQVASLINSQHIHVLVDICGLHANGTMLYRTILARRPAGVQVAYMAFAATTGAAYIDYLVTDAMTSPPEYRAQYSEALLALPYSYHINSHKKRFADILTQRRPQGAALDAARTAAGLPTGGPLICSYNQFFKIDPRVLDAWAALLKAVPSARLVLVKFLFHEHAAQRLRRALEQNGVDGQRLVLVEKVKGDKHLQRSILMDLHLDTRLQSGHTTTVDALWSGLPVVVWPSRSMVSRAASGIAAAAGLHWAIARTQKDYVQLARRLLSRTNREAPSGARRRVADARQQTPLFNFPSWVSRWETALILAVRAAAAQHLVGGTGSRSGAGAGKPALHIVPFAQASSTVYDARDNSRVDAFSASAAAAAL